MEEQLVEAVEKAIDLLVVEFQGNPDRFFNERDMLWGLFHYLKQQDIFQSEYAKGTIRAEFPTRRKYPGKRPARGRYDLVVLHPDSLADPRVAKMKPWDEWDPYLEIVRVLVAVEVKMWLQRRSDPKMADILDWDIEKLTDSENAVNRPYLLNFIQVDFSRSHMQSFHLKLRKHLMGQAERWPQLKILYVPSDTTVQPKANENWI